MSEYQMGLENNKALDEAQIQQFREAIEGRRHTGHLRLLPPPIIGFVLESSEYLEKMFPGECVHGILRKAPDGRLSFEPDVCTIEPITVKPGGFKVVDGGSWGNSAYGAGITTEAGHISHEEAVDRGYSNNTRMEDFAQPGEVALGVMKDGITGVTPGNYALNTPEAGLGWAASASELEPLIVDNSNSGIGEVPSIPIPFPTLPKSNVIYGTPILKSVVRAEAAFQRYRVTYGMPDTEQTRKIYKEWLFMAECVNPDLGTPHIIGPPNKENPNA